MSPSIPLIMPWARGLWDGQYNHRIEYTAVHPGPAMYAPENVVYKMSWPDFRDPVTEAWLVAWCIETARRRGWFVEECFNGGGSYWIDTGRGIFGTAKTRAEAWILALEKLMEVK